jgi:hypothetical protein
VLVFIHLGSRKVYCSPSTYNPTGDWVMQQTRNASIWLDDMGVKARFLIHDRDGEQREVPHATHFPYVQQAVVCSRHVIRCIAVACKALGYLEKPT